MIIKHSFATEPEAIKLFDGVEKLSQFKSRLQKLSDTLPKSNPNEWDMHSDPQENKNAVLGDGFELFCELLVLHMGIHPHIGLANYIPISAMKKDDEGCDAFAMNIKSEKSAVQCKYRSDPNYLLTANEDHLMNFGYESYLEGIESKNQKTKRLFIITTAKDLHHHTVKKFRDNVFVINNNTIRALVDNNIIFWRSCEEKLRKQLGL